MTEYTRRAFLPLALAAFVVAGCNKDDAKLAQDSALARDLARVGTDSTVQPELKDVPTTTTPTTTPTTVPPKKTPAPKPKPVATNPPPSTTTPPPNTTASGNTVTPGSKGSEKPLGSIGAGTSLTLASTEKICTNTNHVGDRFVATVSNDVTGSNGASIPAGSKVTLEVTKLKRSENTNDKIEIGLSVVSISIDGKTYTPDAEIVTAEVDRVRNSSGGNDAKKVAGGAAIGAILGQVLGKNKKGTIIGAAAGAAAGGAAAVATANYEGCVNSGAQITIRLNSSMTVATAN
jgi:hypothetical protein